MIVVTQAAKLNLRIDSDLKEALRINCPVACRMLAQAVRMLLGMLEKKTGLLGNVTYFADTRE